MKADARSLAGAPRPHGTPLAARRSTGRSGGSAAQRPVHLAERRGGIHIPGSVGDILRQTPDASIVVRDGELRPVRLTGHDLGYKEQRAQLEHLAVPA